MTDLMVLVLDDIDRLQIEEMRIRLRQHGVILRAHGLHNRGFGSQSHAERLADRQATQKCSRAKVSTYQLVILGHNDGLGLQFGRALHPHLRRNALVIGDEPLPADQVAQYDDLGFRHLGQREGRYAQDWLEGYVCLHMPMPV